jgi:hypothetical protein
MFGEKARSTNNGMITRRQGLGGNPILFIKQHSCKHDLHNNPGKHAGNIILFI